MAEQHTLAAPITVLHLRSSAGAGGGPDKTIFQEAALIDPARVRLVCAYMRKPADSMEGILRRAQAANAEYLELPGGALFDVRQFRSLLRVLTEQDVSVLHCHEPKGDLYGVLAKRLRPRLQVVTTIHGWTAPRSRRSALYARLDRLFLPRFDLVMAVSKPLESQAVAAGAQHVRYIANGVDTAAWQPHGPVEHPALRPMEDSFSSQACRWVGYVGRLAAEKAPERFLQMAGRLASVFPEVCFVLAGDGPKLETCQLLAKDLGIQDRVVFLGRLEEEAVVRMLRRLALVVNPSRTEGLPNNVLEAMAMSLPVVATAVGGVPDVVKDGETGFLVASAPTDEAEAQGVEALAQKAQMVLEDDALARALGAAGRAHVEQAFSFRSRVAVMESIYESLAGAL